ncbi:MAG TPA: regulatory protein GemA [Methylophilaceae bacterium]|nr:regulatory protein GemA [Methylophilaceae bacterium]
MADMKLGDKLRNSELAQIHIAIKQLGIDDDTYRSILWTVARVSSAKDLDFHQRKQLLEHFKSKGWKARPPVKAKAARPLSTDPQHQMIRGLWLELHELKAVLDPSEAAIQRFIKNQKRVDRIEWLKDNQASDIIEALKAWKARVTK